MNLETFLELFKKVAPDFRWAKREDCLWGVQKDIEKVELTSCVYCPITAVNVYVNHHYYVLKNVHKAGEELGLTPEETWDIVGAADSNPLDFDEDDFKIREIRIKLEDIIYGPVKRLECKEVLEDKNDNKDTRTDTKN